jgi:hypothetical protein
MSGTELDPDGTDSYHPQHPWEQCSHPLYLPPNQRARSNWPPVPTKPAGVHEESTWKAMPSNPKQPRSTKTYGPGFTF